MTVAPALTETVIALHAAGVDAVGPFPTIWPYAAAADVSVYLDLGAGYVALVQGVDYTLAGGNPLEVGGQVTLSLALVPGGGWPVLSLLSLVRATPCEQPSAFGEALGFSPQAAEAALDNLSRQVQELWNLGHRVLALPFGETAPVWPSPPFRGLKILMCDADGIPRWVSPADVIVSFAALSNYPNDAAAAAGGVDVGQVYRNESVLQVRVS